MGQARSSGVQYLLVRRGAAGPVPWVHDGSAVCRPGWTLLARSGSGWIWSIGLDARGAGRSAPAGVAQAVGVRVLAGHGVVVRGWSVPDDAGPDVFHAEVVDPSSSIR